jgi:hypothetical protein
MNRAVISVSLVICQFLTASAQSDQELKGNFFVSPDFGVMFGNINQIEAAPIAGYNISDRLSVAAGPKYEYYSQTRLYSYQTAVKTSIYGVKLFTRFTVFNDIGEFLPTASNTSVYLHLESESTSLEKRYFKPGTSGEGRFWYTAVLAGAGISQPASDRLSFTITLLWDTSGGSMSLYNSPVVRFGILYYLKRADQAIPR